MQSTYLRPTHGISTTQHLPMSVSMPSICKRLPITSKVIKDNSEGSHNVATAPINSYQPNAQINLNIKVAIQYKS
jgi:hypothetical protein